MRERKPMTVKDLCEYLMSHFPPAMPVLTEAYEEGYDDPLITKKRVYKRKSKNYWDGDYHELPGKRDTGNVQAVIISGMRRSD